MGDAEEAHHPSKKRAAGREISKDNTGLDDENDLPEQEMGTFKRASDEVLASRRIVKVRRSTTTTTAAATQPNPFAGIRLVPSTEPPTDSTGNEQSDKDGSRANVVESEKHGTENCDKVEGKDEDTRPDAVVASEVKTGQAKAEDKAGGAEEKQWNEEKEDLVAKNGEQVSEASAVTSFQQHSGAENAFKGLAGTCSSTSLFGSFAAQNDGKPLGLFASGNGATATDVPVMREIPTSTGEEEENTFFSANSVLFEFVEGAWKERGKGEVKVNVSIKEPTRARLVMRSRGNCRLVLNASIYRDMKLANMDKRGVTFACINCLADDKRDLSTYALKFKDASVMEDFRVAVTSHQGKAPASAIGGSLEGGDKSGET